MVATAHFKHQVQHYAVTVTRDDAVSATARVREHTFTVSIKRGGGEAGPNAAETLLSALGTCLLTNVQTLAEKMRIGLEEARVEIAATRRNVPPGLVEVHYTLHIKSSAPPEKIQYLHEKAVEWGTVANTLAHGVPIEGKVEIHRP